MTTRRVNRPAAVRGTITVPADKSISPRALILHAIADGTARIDNLLDSADVRATESCLISLGASIEWYGGDPVALVQGNGLRGLLESDDVINCENSGTTMRLLAGLLSGHPILSILTGDESLRRRPMDRIIAPLRKMGATIHARTGDTRAPLVIKGGALRAINYQTPVASAQVKSAILLAGLYAEGITRVCEPAPSRDHTERMLAAMGAPIEARPGEASISPPGRLEPLSRRVPGDFSSAAPWLVLAACHPQAELLLRDVNVNPTRTGLLDINLAMGDDIDVQEERSTGAEPVADIVVRSSRLAGVEVGGDLVPRAIDELPVVALLACFAEGETIVRDAAELRVKESDRVDAVVRALGAMGADIAARPDGFGVRGPYLLRGARIDADGDHRIGMLAAVAGARAEGETHVEDDAVEVSYPRFWDDLASAAQGEPERA